MSRWMRVPACLAIVLVTAAGQPSAPVHRSVAPLGHWKGDDGEAPKAALDASGNGFHGAYSAGSASSADVPKTQFTNPGCIRLDGTAGVVTVPDSPALRLTGDMTLAFWKRKTAIAKDWTRIVGKGNGTQRNFGLWEFPEGSGHLKFQMYSAGGQSVLELDTPSPTQINTWYHVAITVSVNAAAFYLNGARVANALRTGEPGTAADPLTFGHAGYHGFWPGDLDDIRIYDRALSMGEIVYLAEGKGVPAAPAGLAASSAGPKEVALKWTASPTAPPAGTCTWYVVKRSATAGAGHATVATLMSATTCTDTRPDAGAAYSYVVTAVNTAGESVPSNEVTAAPSPK